VLGNNLGTKTLRRGLGANRRLLLPWITSRLLVTREESPYLKEKQVFALSVPRRHLDMVRINHGSECIPGVQLQTTTFIY
jgi:hypothetical protein